ncbi:Hsp70 family protein [Roseobacter sp. HKCCA0434]|uniref:Hsp70 family protein n=1 Tax=Roseobacter sp. HKCCA0434 TaxID=3079297 RepID=UPI002905C988|nr:Hsp70 family protein [Roseobacter sp. HKCCA0434]
MGAVLALDFGTSNSAAAMLDGGHLRRIPMEDGADTLPTAVFFPTEGGPMQVGEAAARALIAGEDGRYMRALKSVLGTALIDEERMIGGRRRTLSGVITEFLREVKARAEARTGQRFDHVLSGRPVRFHSGDPDRDRRAEADLLACYRAAGFDDIRFRYEPEAAALAAHAAGDSDDDGLGLIVDIGGGTSDFSVFRARNRQVEVLASHGIRLGGTDFDRALSMRHVMPLLGHGGELRRPMGGGHLPVPNGIYADLATWAKIPFLYTRETERLVEGLVRDAVEPEKLERLGDVIEQRLGHDIAFAVERGKIAANGNQATGIDLAVIEPGLEAPLDAAGLDATLGGFADDLSAAIAETLAFATVDAAEIGTVVLVGGSSLMGLVEHVARSACPGATLARAQAFTAVVDGLALASDD